MAHALAVTEDTFKKEVLQSDIPVLVDFWAAWCSPCRAIAPTIEALAKDYKGRLLVGKVDVEEHAKIAQRYKIQSIPTLVLFKGGKVAVQIVGAVSRAKIETAIKKVLEDGNGQKK
jgi:thioredoxin 1